MNIRHSVGGVSDFGRDRHIIAHSNLYENDWSNDIDKLQYLIGDLDAYFGRDNGLASFLFNYSSADTDPSRPNRHDPDSLSVMLDYWRGFFDDRLNNENRTPFKNKIQSMVMGTNPHPTYPTLSYNHASGSVWGRDNGSTWIPQDIQTSAEWMVQYTDEFFSTGGSAPGQPMPEYWEVINEPDFLLNTGKFMMSSWEDIWEYHNLVYDGIKNKLGSRAPKIGGMTWGSHDLFNNDQFSRYQTVDYVNSFYGNTPADEVAKAYARSQVASPFLGQNGPWFQWDVIWKGFLNATGSKMDFYSVHLYDWPSYDANGGVTRAGGHVEATLDMLENYDINKFGTRTPIIISEYGGVNNAWDYKPHDKRYDWEIMKPFSSMLMQFLERPDYIELSMPFTPIKATWGDVDTNGDGIPEHFYQYKMLRDDDRDGNWEWSDYIKWFELWSEVKGTRVDTKSSDPDIQVDCYIDGNDAYLILNNLEPVAKTIDLNYYGNTPGLQSVSSKHLYLSGVRNINLDSNNLGSSAPNTVQLAADGTMILKYTYANTVNIDQSSIEKKFYGPDLSADQRVTIQNGDNTFVVNGVSVPPNADQAEVMLRVTANLFNDDDDKENGFLTINKLVFNGTEVDTPIDWRGGNQLRSRWFGTLEIPIPASLVQTNNTVTIDFQHVGEVCYVNLSTWEFSTVPGRSNPVNNPPLVPVTGVSVSPTSGTLSIGQTLGLTETVSPSNATNKTVTWSSSNTGVATVDTNGMVTAIASGTANVTVTTQDGSFPASASITVNNSNPPGQLVIEAETFNSTSGTVNDAPYGGPGLGVNATASNINYVNNGDWAEYTINVTTAGTYNISYNISTPSNNAQIQFSVNGTVASTTNVPNNGAWDTYGPLNGGSVTLPAGLVTIRLTASGSNAWQWNLDKVTLTGSAALDATQLLNTGNNSDLRKNAVSNKIMLYPNPAKNQVRVVMKNDVESADLTIMDIQGKVIHKKRFSGRMYKINTNRFKEGLYLIQVKTAHKNMIKKLVLVN